MNDCITNSVFIHKSVLVDEVLKLVPNTGKLVADFTVGLGGHLAAILEAFPEYKAIGFDKDKSILNLNSSLTKYEGRYKLIHADFIKALDYLKHQGLKPDFLLLDLGVSSYQLDNEKRGFSFSRCGLLDMRMDQSQGLSAEDVVNDASAKELITIFRKYSQEPFSKKIALAIVEARKQRRIKTTKDLVDIITANKPRFTRRHHPATLVFQALRMYVNQELEQLQHFLDYVENLKLADSVIAVITFNSLEDRIIKRRFAFWQKKCICPPLAPICNCGHQPLATKISSGFIVPTEHEIKLNYRSRSAKLRAIKFLS